MTQYSLKASVKTRKLLQVQETDWTRMVQMKPLEAEIAQLLAHLVWLLNGLYLFSHNANLFWISLSSS